jgi:SET domain-containing protein
MSTLSARFASLELEISALFNSCVRVVNEATDLNGKVNWNPVRPINHSCEPNCEANVDENDRIWIFFIKPVAREEELTFNYGYGLEV